MSDNQTCNFCRTIFTPNQLSNPIYQKRASYCKSSCPLKKEDPRYSQAVKSECQNFMKGVFESFVADAERGVTIFGVKTFDTLYNEVKREYQYLSDNEYTDLLDIIQEFEIQYGNYIDLVLNQNKFYEIASSGGPKELKTPADWAAAIRNLNRILVLANQGIEGRLSMYLNKAATEKKIRECKKSPKNKCFRPCSTEGGYFGKTCTYKGSPKYRGTPP